MLVDLAVLSYYHALRVQGWIGDLALRIEHEFFGDDAFTEMARKGFRRADRFAVEERVRQLSEQLMPLFDRANRMIIRAACVEPSGKNSMVCCPRSIRNSQGTSVYFGAGVFGTVSLE